jgi:hypothetical protein
MTDPRHRMRQIIALREEVQAKACVIQKNVATVERSRNLGISCGEWREKRTNG